MLRLSGEGFSERTDTYMERHFHLNQLGLTAKNAVQQLETLVRMEKTSEGSHKDDQATQKAALHTF